MIEKLRTGADEYLNEALIKYNQKEYDEAEAMLLPLEELIPDEPALHLLLAKCRTRNDDLDAAMESIKRCIQLGLEDSDVVNQKGIIHFQKKETQEAEKLLLEAVEMDPDFIEAATNLMGLYAFVNKSHEFFRWANHVVSLSTDIIKKHLEGSDPGKLFDGYASRARARWLMEDVRPEVILKDIQKAKEQFEKLPPMEQDQLELDWLLETEQLILDKQP